MVQPRLKTFKSQNIIGFNWYFDIKLFPISSTKIIHVKSHKISPMFPLILFSHSFLLYCTSLETIIYLQGLFVLSNSNYISRYLTICKSLLLSLYLSINLLCMYSMLIPGHNRYDFSIYVILIFVFARFVSLIISVYDLLI